MRSWVSHCLLWVVMLVFSISIFAADGCLKRLTLKVANAYHRRNSGTQVLDVSFSGGRTVDYAIDLASDGTDHGTSLGGVHVHGVRLNGPPRWTRLQLI